ncbi:F0F1 ATP synthase subunit delta [Chitinimonas sp. BJB300]|uniref:F0F1 ATP synthase subunit delta n=1 Tax=Chitinimonas sp. BJB300 TaxID=1559339 RepID=UPI000C0EA375|nr:F0F1 ATP synthase subunit delta [Chitinimonas sp. BJB300]PHV12677.1 F0F1 ATP synthase subunit delta [Chitinimonas sp. BJB300]TSJ91279.1 F0F1 ATP synthase subunit delta [Chitinimonas sp. BJB300]
MAELITVARPYAEAAFRLAKEANSLPAWSEALAVLAAAAQDPLAVEFAANPKFSASQVQALLTELLGARATPHISNFVSTVLESRRFVLLPYIADLFEQLKAVAEGSVTAHIESAFDLSGTQLDEIKSILADRTGKKVETTVSINPDLIGGVRMTVGDDVIDASVRGKLAALSARLAH